MGFNKFIITIIGRGVGGVQSPLKNFRKNIKGRTDFKHKKNYILNFEKHLRVSSSDTSYLW